MCSLIVEAIGCGCIIGCFVYVHISKVITAITMCVYVCFSFRLV